VTHLGPFEGERSASTSGPEPYRDDDRDHHRDPVRTVRSYLVDLRGGELAVTDQSGTDEDRDRTEDRGEIRLVERVDPMDVGQPLAAPDSSPLEQRAFEVSVRVGEGNAVQRYSCTSSMSVPNAAFGCTNATVVPREPGRGCSSIT
jgi:hypothetical protein